MKFHVLENSRFIRKHYSYYFLLALLVGTLVACSAKPIDSLRCQTTDVTSQPLPRLEVNVYLDGTPSMRGYVTPQGTQYIRTLDAMFNMLAQNTPETLGGEPSVKPNVNYFRLGRNRQTGASLQALGSGSQHLRAMDPVFYGGSGFPGLEVASIDAAIDASPGSAEGMTIIVTDLYEEEQHIDKLVSKITQQLGSIEQGAVGIVGIRSEFDGIVYTEALRGLQEFPFKLTSAPRHPFYIVFIGRVDEVSFYIRDLKKRLKDFSEGSVQAVVFSYDRIYKEVPKAQRKAAADFPESVQPYIQVPAYRMSYGRLVRLHLKDESVQPFILKQAQKAFSIPFQRDLQSIEDVFYPASLQAAWSFRAQSFDAIQKSFTLDNNSALENAVKANNSTLTASSLNFELEVDPKQFRSPGIYFFTLDASALPRETSDNALIGQWKDWSADPFDSKLKDDGSRTHNLDDLLEGLSRATMAKLKQKPVQLGQYCYVIQSS